MGYRSLDNFLKSNIKNSLMYLFLHVLHNHQMLEKICPTLIAQGHICKMSFSRNVQKYVKVVVDNICKSVISWDQQCGPQILFVNAAFCSVEFILNRVTLPDFQVLYQFVRKRQFLHVMALQFPSRAWYPMQTHGSTKVELGP